MDELFSSDGYVLYDEEYSTVIKRGVSLGSRSSWDHCSCFINNNDFLSHICLMLCITRLAIIFLENPSCVREVDNGQSP